ncbi:hypothetical protein ACFYUV_05910 [Nonomuraea sp. NPDC003560]|uniref:hypothetical protein n=1 Tax=Nonomuraea sp. NPDC003560 TaxID=3364341 RepID=UPI0036CAE360
MNTSATLPPAAPHVVAAAVDGLTSRLRKKLDAAVDQYAALGRVADGTDVVVTCGEDAVVTLSPGPSGVIAEEGQARCSCLLAPRCLHRAALLTACPLADPADTLPLDVETDTSPSRSGQPDTPSTDGRPAQPATEPGRRPDTHQAGAEPGPGPEADQAGGDSGSGPRAGQQVGAASGAGSGAGQAGAGSGRGSGEAVVPAAPGAAQVAAAAGLWRAAAAVLSAGVPGAGAVPQAELLRAAHTARLAGLPRAEAATLRVVRGLRAARARYDSHRLADLVSALRELLLTVGRLAASDPDPALVGTVRRGYRPNGGLKVYGVFREPVISSTGYGGVVTHLVTDDGRWFSVADVKPGGPARARGAATATVAIGAAMMSHAQLARGGLLIAGATVSPDGRLGAGKGVRATPVAGLAWTDGPLGALFARPLSEAVGARLSAGAWSEEEAAEQVREPVGCDLVIVGAAGDHVLARHLPPTAPPQPAEAGGAVVGGEGPVVRLVPANRHPDLAYVENLRRLASRPGLRVRVVARVEPGRAATLVPLAVGPVAGEEATLRLPPEWQGRADLGYDRLQGSHLPPADAGPSPADADPSPGRDAYAEMDPLDGAPLWRVRRLVELAVSGGRRAVAESARGGDARGQAASLRRAGFRTAADLAVALADEADRRERDVFGRPAEADPDGYARAWLTAATHLAATERALVRTSWQATP